MTNGVLGVTAVAVVLIGCLQGRPDLSERTAAVIYGADDRTEYFQIETPDWRARMAASTVALVPKSAIGGKKDAGYVVNAPSWGEVATLCPGTRFADQPAAALCTGVLVDWDLVLTADHCMRVLALDDIAVVFGYYYQAPGMLAVDGVGQIASILDEALDPEGVTPRLDYAWLRLRAPAPPLHQPAPIDVGMPTLTAGLPVVSIGAGGGVPFKLDSGGRVRDARAESGDYFIADTDTFEGSSGGGAFDENTTLLGILARGGDDFVPTADNCNEVAQQPDGAAAEEQFTYASQAVAALCAKNPASSSICRSDCSSPCLAGPPPPTGGGQGCTLAGTAPHERIDLLFAVGAAAFFAARRRRSNRPPSRRERYAGPAPMSTNARLESAISRAKRSATARGLSKLANSMRSSSD